MMRNDIRKIVTVAALSAVVSFACVYWMRWRRWAVWRKVPAKVWEQVAAEIRSGPQSPLDAAQVLADVQAWLNGGGDE
jgi:hypothetical protein